MDATTAFLLIGLVLALLAMLAAGLWVAMSLLSAGLLTGLLLTSNLPIGSVVATTLWDASTNWALTSVPLFIWMGEILSRSRVSEDLFEGLTPLVKRIPGRLLHVNVLACAVMAAISGSSAVTCATIARIAVPKLRERGYDNQLSIGTLAGSGTLGLLIPPSIMMIIYGVVAEVSVARLFIAGVLPGILLVVLFSSYVLVRAWRQPNLAPPPRAEEDDDFTTRRGSVRRLTPTILLIAVVIGAMYGGFATPTEGAAVGTLGALILAASSGDLNVKMFNDSVMAALQTSCMLGFLVACASVLAVVMGFTGIPTTLARWVASLELSATGLLVALSILYLVLGCFLDGISMILITAPIVIPMIKAVGIDPLWFGIFVVIMVEIAQITPPVGINLFVMQSITNEEISRITLASLPFFFLMIAAVVILWIFPEIVLFLPGTMYNAR